MRSFSLLAMISIAARFYQSLELRKPSDVGGLESRRLGPIALIDDCVYHLTECITAVMHGMAMHNPN
jgi:hypothetical protein